MDHEKETGKSKIVYLENQLNNLIGEKLKKLQEDNYSSRKTAFFYFINNTCDQINLNPSKFFEGFQENVQFCELYLPSILININYLGNSKEKRFLIFFWNGWLNLCPEDKEDYFILAEKKNKDAEDKMEKDISEIKSMKAMYWSKMLKIHKEDYGEEESEEDEIKEFEEDAFEKWIKSFSKEYNFGFQEPSLCSGLPNFSVIILRLSIILKYDTNL